MERQNPLLHGSMEGINVDIDTWRYRLMVRTLASPAENDGSNPSTVAIGFRDLIDCC